MSAARPLFRIGPSGWSYQDWYGIVYPSPAPAGFKPLAYLARYFNTVEVNSTFYRVPTPRLTAAWPPQVPADFRFAFKLHQSFTHGREKFPDPAAVEEFTNALRPVREAGRLGPLLIQFPWSLRHTPEAVAWLQRIADSFPDFQRFIEVRHVSWTRPAALADLARYGGYCNIDQPRARDCIGPTTHVFGRTAYVRLHGRNFANWFRRDQPAYARYDYLYTPEELAEWVARLNDIGERAEEVYVFANNHYRGQGPVNALELKALVLGQKVDVPAPLRASFPGLEQFATEPAARNLFGEALDER